MIKYGDLGYYFYAMHLSREIENDNIPALQNQALKCASPDRACVWTHVLSVIPAPENNSYPVLSAFDAESIKLPPLFRNEPVCEPNPARGEFPHTEWVPVPMDDLICHMKHLLHLRVTNRTQRIALLAPLSVENLHSIKSENEELLMSLQTLRPTHVFQPTPTYSAKLAELISGVTTYIGDLKSFIKLREIHDSCMCVLREARDLLARSNLDRETLQERLELLNACIDSDQEYSSSSSLEIERMLEECEKTASGCHRDIASTEWMEATYPQYIIDRVFQQVGQSISEEHKLTDASAEVETGSSDQVRRASPRCQ